MVTAVNIRILVREKVEGTGAAMGKTPHGARGASRSILQVMKTHDMKINLTFGQFVESVYNVCGKRKAGGIVRLALKAHLIEFRHR